MVVVDDKGGGRLMKRRAEGIRERHLFERYSSVTRNKLRISGEHWVIVELKYK